MKKLVKKRWIKALRSGEYEQGEDYLHTDDGQMCCLGVLYDIEFDGDWELSERESFVVKPYEIEGNDRLLSEHFRISMGLSTADEDYLVSMNDEGSSFEEIADFIEEHL